MKVILICGSRGWKDPQPIEELLAKLGNDIILIQGGCRGPDLMAKEIALRRGVHPDNVITVKPNWDRDGRGATFVRNQKMLDDYPVTEVYAFRATGKSNGTDDMCRRSRKAGIEPTIYTA